MTTALAERTGSTFNPEQLDLIKRTVAKDASDDELSLFLYTAQSRGLDPLLKQIHGVSRWDNSQKRKVMSIQVGIDGYRLIAARTGDYAGNDDVVFVDGPEFPLTATATVHKFVQGMRCPFSATARWDEYCPQPGQDFMWKRMPHTMLGKCAEALALRKAFPAEMSGLYVDEEMQQAGPAAESTPRVIEQAPQASTPTPAPKTIDGTGPLIHERDPLWKAYTDLAAEASRLKLWGMPDIAPPIRQSELVKIGKALRDAVNARKTELAAQQTAIYGTEEQSFADLPAAPPPPQELGRSGAANPAAPEPAGTRGKGKRNVMTEANAAYHARADEVPMIEGEEPRFRRYMELMAEARTLDIPVDLYDLNTPVEASKVEATIVALEQDILAVEQAESEAAQPAAVG